MNHISGKLATLSDKSITTISMQLAESALMGVFTIKRVKHWLIRPGTVKFVVDEAIPYESSKNLCNKELKDLVRNKIQSLIENA